MKTGDVLKVRTVREYTPEGSWFSYTAPDGKMFVILLLGVENKDGSDPLNVPRVLDTLGYHSGAGLDI